MLTKAYVHTYGMYKIKISEFSAYFPPVRYLQDLMHKHKNNLFYFIYICLSCILFKNAMFCNNYNIYMKQWYYKKLHF